MTDDAIEQAMKDLVGTVTTRATVLVERGPVAHFAEAVLETTPVYQWPEAARAAGFDDIPAPPTFAFAMESWGRFPELQPPDAPSGGEGFARLLDPLMAKGGIMLHGEQEFVYHRPIVVGDLLEGEGRVVDVYQKEARGRTMTFIVTETQWRDRSGDPVVTTTFNLIHRG